MSVHEWLLRSCIAWLRWSSRGEGKGGGGLDPHALVISNLLDSQSKIAENMPVRIPSTPISEKKLSLGPQWIQPTPKKKVMAPYVHSPF